METKFADDNYFQVQGWMVNILKLKGNDLMIFAIIHGFSQDGKSYFYGSNGYICSAIGASKNTVLASIKNLENSSLIIKYQKPENGVLSNFYRINKKHISDIITGAEIAPLSKIEPVQKLDFTGAEIAPNNNIYNNIEYLNKIKMSQISVSDDFTKLYTDNFEIEVDKKEGYMFKIANQFRILFIKNIEQTGARANHQINATYRNYIHPLKMCVEKDGYTSDHLREVYELLNGDTDEGLFWKKNILSIETLRKKMQKLIIAKNSSTRQFKAPDRL